jgi:HSP20 family molecular chaperone IbpA
VSFREPIPGYIVALILGVLGLLVLGVYLRILFRGGGLLGVSLAVLALALMAYWIRELTRLFKGGAELERIEGEWDVDVIEDSKDITIVARMPSTCEKVAVFLRGRVLQVKGERDLKINIPLKDDVRISGSTYKNRVLQVKLEKILKGGKA